MMKCSRQADAGAERHALNRQAHEGGDGRRNSIRDQGRDAGSRNAVRFAVLVVLGLALFTAGCGDDDGETSASLCGHKT